MTHRSSPSSLRRVADVAEGDTARPDLAPILRELRTEPVARLARGTPLDEGDTSGALAGNDEAGFSAFDIRRPRLAKLIRYLELPVCAGAAGLSSVALWAAQGRAFDNPNFAYTMVALALAITATWHALARLREYAKARHLSYVLPVNFAAFCGALAVIALLRMPYSISLFLTGSMAAVAASFMLAVYNRRISKPHIIVPRGRANEIRIEGRYVLAPSLSDLEALIASGRRDWALVADLHYCHSANWERLFAQAALNGVPVYHFRQIAEMQTGQVKISHLSENDLGSLIPNVPYMSTKRLIDILGALLLLPLCLVPFLALALLIKLDSPGRVFFVQERAGFRGKTFKMIKFRTMQERATLAAEDAKRTDAMTRSDDARITRIGRILRRSRIDELPQIFNILLGHMSFVGPRPEALALAEWYEAELPFYSYRHIVRPGITGWAQVNQGHVTDVTDVLAKVRYDFYYIKNISLWLDLLVALKTIRVILTGWGAK